MCFAIFPLHLSKVLRPHKTTSERPKVLRTPQFLPLLTSKCASRHNGLHFIDISTSKRCPTMVCFVHFDFEMCFAHNGVPFDIATSKSAPKLRCFVHFDLEMCFAPQRRATFYLSSHHMAPHPPL